MCNNLAYCCNQMTQKTGNLNTTFIMWRILLKQQQFGVKVLVFYIYVCKRMMYLSSFLKNRVNSTSINSVRFFSILKKQFLLLNCINFDFIGKYLSCFITFFSQLSNQSVVFTAFIYILTMSCIINTVNIQMKFYQGTFSIYFFNETVMRVHCFK